MLPAQQLELVVHLQPAGGQRPGDHRARAADRERPIHPQPYVRAGVRDGQGGGEIVEGGAQVVQARAGGGRDAHGCKAGERRALQVFERLLAGQLRLEEVAAGDHEQAVADAERRERIDVLGRLRHPALVGGDDEHHRRDRADPGEHRGDEPLVPRDVDEGDLRARGQRRPGEPQVDGHAATALLGPPVGLHPGERPDERRLAVVDVAGRGYDLHGAATCT